MPKKTAKLTAEELAVAADMGLLPKMDELPLGGIAKDLPTEMPAIAAKKASRDVVAVIGSRSLAEWDLATALAEIAFFAHGKEAIYLSGGSKGPDSMVAHVLREKFGCQVTVIRAYWDEVGPGAGFSRNIRLVMNATHVYALWDGVSRGTKHSIDTAERMGKQVKVLTISVK